MVLLTTELFIENFPLISVLYCTYISDFLLWSVFHGEVVISSNLRSRNSVEIIPWSFYSLDPTGNLNTLRYIAQKCLEMLRLNKELFQSSLFSPLPYNVADVLISIQTFI